MSKARAGTLPDRSISALASAVALSWDAEPAIDVRARLTQIFHLFAEDSWRRVYAGESKWRPPRAPTTGSVQTGIAPNGSAAPRERGRRRPGLETIRVAS